LQKEKNKCSHIPNNTKKEWWKYLKFIQNESCINMIFSIWEK
jgi:hypothetical protein